MSDLIPVHNSPLAPYVPTLGRNAGDRTLTRAHTDLDICSEWLSFYVDRPRTFESYQREGQRLLMWCENRGLTLPELVVDDVRAFREFLATPEPAEKWCVQAERKTLADGTPNPAWRSTKTPRKVLADGSLNPDWRPFTNGGLSDSAAEQAIAVISGLLEYAASVGYLSHNPVKIFRKRAKAPVHHQDEEIERYLEPAVWTSALAALGQAPRESVRDLAHYHRRKFLLSILYCCGLRRDELSRATTADLRARRGRWGLRVQGKGGKIRRVPLAESALKAIAEYRVSLGRSPLPLPEEPVEPLIMDIYGKGRPLTGKAIYQVVKATFDAAAALEIDPYKARVLREASTHWLRHTCASHMLDKGVSLKGVQSFLGHASIGTTSKYLHKDWDSLHDEVQVHGI